MSFTTITNFAVAVVAALIAEALIGSPNGWPWWAAAPAGAAVGFAVMLLMIHVNPEPRKPR